MAALTRTIVKKSLRHLRVAGATGALLTASTLPPLAHAQEAEPSPISQCQSITKPGAYRLATNVTFTGSGTCLSIKTSNVTLDLAGFTISGPVTPPGNSSVNAVAVGSSPSTVGVAVRNGSITGFGAGVNLNGTGAVVEKVRVSRGTQIGIGATGTIRGNTVVGIVGNQNLAVGIFGAGLLEGNYVEGVEAVGIVAEAGSAVVTNVVTGGVAQGFGISAFCPSSVVGNTSTNNHGANLKFSGSGCVNVNNVAP